MKKIIEYITEKDLLRSEKFVEISVYSVIAILFLIVGVVTRSIIKSLIEIIGS